MKRHPLITVLLALVLALGGAANSLADISSAAVLFLRIAPGPRAAGMGEAYVAVADDATATHWNPAGLGNYPLASSWINAEVPQEFRPLRKVAAVGSADASNYLDYEIWALSVKGLIRYDNRNWHTEEVFSTRTDETLARKVRAYFNLAESDQTP